MLFSGKENVFMCLIAFQKKFRKIFSGVWKRRRKRQNPEKKNHQIRSNWEKKEEREVTGFDEGRDRTAEAKITIGVKARSWSTARSFSLCAFARSFFLSLVLPLRVCELSFRVSVPEIIWSENRNGNEFPWSTLLFYGQLKMISGKFYFQNQPNNLFYEKWFPETIFTQNKHTLRL